MGNCWLVYISLEKQIKVTLHATSGFIFALFLSNPMVENKRKLTMWVLLHFENENEANSRPQGHSGIFKFGTRKYLNN